MDDFWVNDLKFFHSDLSTTATNFEREEEEEEVQVLMVKKVDKGTQVYNEDMFARAKIKRASKRDKQVDEFFVRKEKERKKKLARKAVDFKSKTNRYVLTDAQREQMSKLEEQVYGFLQSMISDYDKLSFNPVDRCSHKDLNGKIKIYTKRCINHKEEQFFVVTREAQTQTKSMPSYMLSHLKIH